MTDVIDFASIRQSVALSEIVGRSVKLRRAGRELQGCCPFHLDKSPSFYVDDAKRVFLCFGCGATGDVLDFVMRADGVTLPEAARLLGGSEWSARPAKVAKAAKA